MKRLNMPGIAEDRQRMLLRMAEGLSTDRTNQVDLRLSRSEDVLLMVENFAYLADRPRLRALRLYYVGPPPAAQPVPTTIGPGLDRSAVDEFAFVSDYHVVRGIHGNFGRRLRRLSLVCSVDAVELPAFPLIERLGLSGIFRGGAVRFPALAHLTLTQLDFRQTTLPQIPVTLDTLVYKECVLDGDAAVPTSARRCVIRQCTADGDAIGTLLQRFCATLEDLRIEEMRTPMDEIVLSSACAKLGSIEIRRVDVDAVRFRAASAPNDVFASLTTIVLERDAAADAGDMAITADAPERIQRLTRLLAPVTTIEMRGHPYFFLPALAFPQLETYRGAYAIDPADVLPTREMDMDIFLPSTVTPWHTHLLHLLRTHNLTISLVSGRGRAFDIARRRAPYFRKVAVAPADAIQFFQTEKCLICSVGFSEEEHAAERAADVETNDFLDDPYTIKEQEEHGCVVRCNDPRPEHAKHYMHRGCFSQFLFRKSPNYVDPYNIPLT